MIVLLSNLVINEKFDGLFQRNSWRFRTELLNNRQIKKLKKMVLKSNLYTSPCYHICMNRNDNL